MSGDQSTAQTWRDVRIQQLRNALIDEVQRADRYLNQRLQLEDAVLDAVDAFEADKPGQAFSILTKAIDQLVLSTMPPLRKAMTRASRATKGKLAANHVSHPPFGELG